MHRLTQNVRTWELFFFQKRSMKILCISASTLDVDTLSLKSVPLLRQRTSKKKNLCNYFCSRNEF